MIPTSVTSSSPPTACLGSMGSQINNSPTIIGSAKSSNCPSGSVSGQGQGNNSAFLGIASLILEGRALAEDEYAIQISGYDLKATLSGSSSECGRQSPKPSTSKAAFGENISGGMTTSSLSIDFANYSVRKSSHSPESTTTSFLRDYCNSSSGESTSSSVESNHSRWSQKLSQLRQESPNAHHQAVASRQKLGVECPRGSDAEYVALAINTDHHNNYYSMNEDKKVGDFEILRRMSINHINFYNSPNSMVGSGGGVSGVGGGGGSSENFMCSLQSLASNTCLRVGNPLLLTTTSPPRYINSRQISPSTSKYTTSQQQQLDCSIGTPSSSGSSGGSGSGGVSVNSWYTSYSSSSNCNSSNSKDYLRRQSTKTTQRMTTPTPQTAKNKTTINSSTSIHNLHSNIFNRSKSNSIAATATTTSAATASRNQTSPKQGPHCDQFLKKMGLAKGDASETEEHHCDMSYVNITCTRWRAYCIKMENILACGEPISIEVYLGPVGHKVLLEQWIITQKEKQPPPTMTLPSLCSAIRSQLYFSQISAWCDLIKKSDKTVNETGRVIYTTPQPTSAAGDLVTTTNNATSTTSAHHPPSMSCLSTTLPTSGSGIISGGIVSVGCVKRRPLAPRLNIFYRIKQYDSTACFNSKPNIHNFPSVNISENCSVSVCLKSLPRITGGIPKIGKITTTTQQQNIPPSGFMTTALETQPVKSTTCLVDKNNTIVKATTSASTSATSNAASVAVKLTATANTIITTNANKSTILKMNCDNNLKEHQQNEKPFIASTSSSSPCCSYSNSKNDSKPSNKDHINLQDVDFEYYDSQQHNIDLSAGGDNSNILCGSDMTVATGGLGDCDSSNSSYSTNNYGNLSHREKQLQKYRKRMLKRDKKHQLRKTNDETSNQMQIQTEKINIASSKMEQEDDGDNGDNVNVHDVNNDNDGNNSDTADCSERKYSVNSLAKGQRQQLPNNQNSIPCTNLLRQMQQQQELQLRLQNQHQHHVKMISTGTQTVTNSCISCGSEKSMICLKCNPLRANNDDDSAIAITTATVTDSSYNYEEIMDAETTSSASSLSSSDIIHTPRNKAELLLQAIQRTPKSNKNHKHKSKESNQMAAIKQQQQQQHGKSPTTTISTIINSNSSNLIRNSLHNSNKWSSSANISHSNSRSSSTSSSINGIAVNSNSNNGNNMVGCQMCKRQKTQHNFYQPSNEEITPDDNNSLANISLSSSRDNNIMPVSSVGKTTNQHRTSDDNGDDRATDDDSEKDGGKIPLPDAIDNVTHGNDVLKMSFSKSFENLNDHEVMEEEYFETSTKLTPQIDRCSLGVKDVTEYVQISRSDTTAATDTIEYQSRSCSTPPLEEQKENSSITDGNTMLAQFKTPTSGENYQNTIKNSKQQPLQPHKHTPKPNLLHIACSFNKADHQQKSKLNLNSIINNNNNNDNTPTTQNPLLLRRSLPKVNLTPIFCNSNSMMNVSSSPIPIGNGVCNGTANGLAIKSADMSVTETSPTFSFESPSIPAPSITVQKSNSAPTLPNSPSLSPRFIKATAIYKRRSRHLSDRSDRSSLGSDEQISDEDIDSGMYSPFATSPIKLRTRLAAVFGRKPMLGNLEECLLQRRLVPKVEVMGFKLLLGASGGFCPTQLTIPAAAYFYELKGETLSTPYLCEIRLPRKGYTVPRCGTVQATLLNPMGTVVRMFVIPYDMRDMPTLHQTFIRQRILADTGLQNNNDVDNQNGVEKQFNDVSGGSITTGKQKKREQEIQTKKQQHQQNTQQQQQRSPQCNNENQLGHFISAENMKSLRYSIHLRFQTSRTGRLMLHTDIRLLISRRTDCDTAASYAKGVLEAPNELITNTVMPTNPKYSARQDQTTSKM